MVRRELGKAEAEMARVLELWRDQICLTAHSIQRGVLVGRPGTPWAVATATSHLVGLRAIVSHIGEYIAQLTGETPEEQAEASCMSGIAGGTEYLIDILRPQITPRQPN